MGYLRQSQHQTKKLQQIIIIFCLIVQILVAIVDCETINSERYILGLIIILLSELFTICFLFKTIEINKAAFWTSFSLQIIGMLLIYNEDIHQILLFGSCVVIQLTSNTFDNTFQQQSQVQQSYCYANNFIQQFLDSQRNWQKTMKIRLTMIANVIPNKQFTMNEQIQTEKLLTYSINSIVWIQKLNQYYEQIDSLYNSKLYEFIQNNQKMKTCYHIFMSRLYQYIKKLEDELQTVKEINIFNIEQFNNLERKTLIKELDILREKQIEIIDWFNDEEMGFNSIINQLLQQIENRKHTFIDNEIDLNPFITSIETSIMSFNLDKQQLIYSIIQQQGDLRKLKHKYLRRLNKINSLKFQQSNNVIKTIDENILVNIKMHYEQTLSQLINTNIYDQKQKIIKDLILEIISIHKEKIKLEEEIYNLKNLIQQTESQVFCEDSQRLLTKLEDSFIQSNIGTQR